MMMPISKQRHRSAIGESRRLWVRRRLQSRSWNSRSDSATVVYLHRLFFFLLVALVAVEVVEVAEANPSVTLVKPQQCHQQQQEQDDDASANTTEVSWTSPPQTGLSLANMTDVDTDTESYTDTEIETDGENENDLQHINAVDDEMQFSSSDEGEEENSDQEEEEEPLQYSSYKLKNIKLTKSQTSAAATTTRHAEQQQRQHHQQRQTMNMAKLMNQKTRNAKRTIWNDVSDDFNFKGYGVSLYKSFLKARTVGMSCRLPLLSNFDWWDSRPYLPSLNCIVAMYVFPLRFSFGFSSSVPVEGIRTFVYKWIVLFAYEFTMRVIHHMLSSLHTLWSLLMYPWVNKWDELPERFRYAIENAEKAHRTRCEAKTTYNTDVMERLGCSFSWRWSPLRGYETRTSYWHMYAPQTATILEQVYQLVSKTKKLKMRNRSSDVVDEDDTMIEKDSAAVTKHSPITEWLRSLASPLANSCLGIDTSAPNPLPPNFFLTGILSMSGFGCGTSSSPHIGTSTSMKQRSKILPRIPSQSQPNAGKGLSYHQHGRNETSSIIPPSTVTLISPIAIDSSSIEDDQSVDTKKRSLNKKKDDHAKHTVKVARGGEGALPPMPSYTSVGGYRNE
mmetsp:Transcript_60371/g.148134  ORF Transcript_60371/g.148134 Transcript_60371/m.148134 type:complete len:617 (+) Transcript_60371:237-2087(+)